jgi:DNA-binding GntR family transcriptional regulator
VPIYIQLKEYIQQQIAQGHLMPGTRVMSETEIAEKFQISRITIRKAFGEMVDEGYLVRKKGKGTFIKDIRFREEASATSISRTCQKLGMIPGSKVIEVALSRRIIGSTRRWTNAGRERRIHGAHPLCQQHARSAGAQLLRRGL